MSSTVELELPEALDFLWTPSRFKVAYGGRGSSKSTSVALYLLIRAMQRRERILCAREFQNSIRDSVHRLLSDIIRDKHLDAFFATTQFSIVGKNGSEFLFTGLAHHSVDSVKSFEGISIAWLEEAQRISQRSLDILIPTIRLPGSEIIFTYNPEQASDPVHARFVVKGDSEALCKLVNWSDNPWFPGVLRREMEYCRSVDYDKYRHVWEGNTLQISNACIFKGKYVVEPFEYDPATDGMLRFGADFGFAKDPATLVRCFVRGRRLYVDYAVFAHGCGVDELPALYRTVPESTRSKLWADDSRPDTIAYLKKPQHGGFNIEGAPKGRNSVEDGIEFLRAFEMIVVHPRCADLIYEFGAYSYKVDKLSEDILPVPVDENNHGIDGLRYAMYPLRQGKVTIFDIDVTS